MRIYLRILLVIAIGLFGSCSDKKQEKTGSTEATSAKKYTCPMHPQIIQDQPGSCPICGMDLVPMTETVKEEVMLSASQIQLANIKTVKVSGSSFSTSKVLNGRLVTDPNAAEVISSRYPGRIEKLFVKETGAQVAKGQPLFQIYSEQLQALQLDYLLQSKQAASFPQEKIYQNLKESARNKLLLFGYSERQIRALVRSNKVSPSITVSSAVSGVVREIAITEGQYVSEGSPLFRIESFGSLWLEADVYPSEAGLVKVGTPLKVLVNGSQQPENVEIDFIAPQLNPSSQILTVRASLRNQGGEYQAGMQATAFLPVAKVSEGISLPIDAVIRNSEGAHVWLKTGENTFAPRMVATGPEDADQVVVTSGLKDGDAVVSYGAYLLYSEFVLKKGTEPFSGHKH